MNKYTFKVTDPHVEDFEPYIFTVKHENLDLAFDTVSETILPALPPCKGYDIELCEEQ